MKSLLAIACALLLTAPIWPPRSAHAQLEPAPEQLEPLAPAPELATPFIMPDLRTSPTLDVEVGSYARQGELGELTTLDVYGHIATSPASVLFARLPMAYLHNDGIRELDLGNLTLGARRVKVYGNQRSGIDAAVTLPTAPRYIMTDRTTRNGAAAYLASRARYVRSAHYAPRTAGISVHGHLRYDNHIAFVQSQLGYERYWRNVDDMNQPPAALDLLRLAVAAGWHVDDRLAVIAELTNLSLFLEDMQMEQTRSSLFHWLDVGVRYRAEHMVLGVQMSLPVDPPTLSDADFMNAYGLLIHLSTP